MHPQKVDRKRTVKLEDLPNVGKACAGDLRLIGITKPDQLIGRDPFELYDQLCRTTGSRHDPCMIDVFMSVVDFMNGGEPRPWWAFTEERKRYYRRNKTQAGAAHGANQDLRD
ncbi:MAG: helix-hairpin-helix domain-containing protein [Methylococcaceae bacterium]|nr:helix-hairpin-helix domain-containing protein [Methylococcaceae bacterium]